MPVSEAERPYTAVEPNGSFEEKPSTDWIARVDLLIAKRRAILTATLIGMVLFAGLALYYPKYASTVQIMPPDSQQGGLASLAMPSMTKSPGLAGLAGELLGGGKNTTAVFVKILGSRTVEDYLVERFDLRKHYGKKYWEEARDKLRSHTSVTDDKKSGMISVSFEDRNPQFAAAVAAAYAEELDRVVTKTATSSAGREREFIQQRLDEEKQLLDTAQKEFSAFSTRTMALDVPQQTRITVESVARLQGELIARKSELEGLVQIYAPDNFRVKSAQARVTELEKALAKLNSAGGDNPQDATNPYPSVRSLPKLGVQWTDLFRTIKIHETVFELLTQQFEMAKIQEAKEIPTVKILDPASTPEKRYPRPWLVLFVGTIFSLLAACTGVVMYDGWQKIDPADPRRVLIARFYPGAAPSQTFEQRNGSGRETPSQDRKNDYAERRL